MPKELEIALEESYSTLKRDLLTRALLSRIPLHWSPLDVVSFLRSQRLPLDPAAEYMANHEGSPVDGRTLLQDGMSFSWLPVSTLYPARERAPPLVPWRRAGRNVSCGFCR